MKGQNETLLPDWQKESWQTFEETSGHVRLERVNKWPNSKKDRQIMMMKGQRKRGKPDFAEFLSLYS
jgi:hypothetical protein